MPPAWTEIDESGRVLMATGLADNVEDVDEVED